MKTLISRPPPPVDHLTRAAISHLVAAADRNRYPDDVCRERFPSDTATINVLSRATVAPGTTSGWGAELAGDVVAPFIGSLAPHSAIAQIVPSGLSVSLAGAGSVAVPQRATNPIAAAGVAEGEPIPVRANAFSQVPISPGKAAVITVISRELAKRADGQATIETILREDAGATLDGAYLSAAAAGSLPAGLLYGVTATTPDGGAGIEAMKNDLANVAAAAATNGSGDVVVVVSPARAVKISILAPDIKIPVLASIAVPEDRVVAIDPRAIVHGFGGTPEITASESATIHMSTVPLEIVDDSAVVADPVRSMWQTASISLRMILDVAFGKRSATAVAFIDGVTNW